MSNMKIIEIPAYLRDGAGQKGTARKLRVAAYCRVSTEEEEQQGSFEIQKLYYTEKINSTPEWEVAGIYADDGISGVHTKKRDGFNQMIQDCKKRKIDLILTKSISRFARNTLDSIQYVRMLKQMGIAVVFEKGEHQHRHHELRDDPYRTERLCPGRKRVDFPECSPR